MLVKQNFTVVLCGDLWVRTNITINDQLPDGFQHFQKLFWNRERQGITELEFELEFGVYYIFWPEWSCKVIQKSDIFWLDHYKAKNTFRLNIFIECPRCTGFQDSKTVFGNVEFLQKFGHLL